MIDFRQTLLSLHERAETAALSIMERLTGWTPKTDAALEVQAAHINDMYPIFAFLNNAENYLHQPPAVQYFPSHEAPQATKAAYINPLYRLDPENELPVNKEWLRSDSIERARRVWPELFETDYPQHK